MHLDNLIKQLQAIQLAHPMRELNVVCGEGQPGSVKHKTECTPTYNFDAVSTLDILSSDATPPKLVDGPNWILYITLTKIESEKDETDV